MPSFSRSYNQPSVLYWMCLIEFQPSNAHRCCRHSTAAWSTAAAISSAIRSSSRVTAISCWSERRHWRALLTDPGLIHPLTVSRLTCRHSIRNQYTCTENHLNSLQSSITLLTKQTLNFNELDTFKEVCLNYVNCTKFPLKKVNWFNLKYWPLAGWWW